MKRKLLLSTGLVLLYVTSFAQSGITWNATMNVNNMMMYGNLHPRIVLDRSGDPMILWGNSSNSNAYFSKWNGASFSTPSVVNTTLPVFAASWAGPDIASYGDTVYVVVKQTPEMMNPAYIYTSLDGGNSFADTVRLDVYLADSISRFPSVTTDNSGNPVVAYMKINPSFTGARWVVTRSNNFGATFGVDRLATGWSGGDVCDCCPSSIINNGNTVAVLYRDNDANIRDMWTGISTNNGATFTNGYALDTPNWMLMSCPSSGPDGVIIGDTMYSVLMSGYTGDYLVYLSKSSISGLTTSSVIPITGLLPGASTQNYPRIATDGSAVGIVWKQAISGQSQLPLLFTNNINNGFPAQYDTVDLDDVSNADIAIYDGTIHIVWEDPISGTVKYRSGTFMSSLGTEEITANETKVYPNPSSSLVNIQLPVNINGIVQVNITGLLGQQVASFQATCSNGILNFDVSDLSNATYSISIVFEKQQFSTQFIKR